MKNALISPNEVVSYISGWDGQSPIYTELGQRVAEVCDTAFEVAPPLFWIACENSIVSNEVYYNASNQIICPIPASTPQPPKQTA